MRKEIQPRKGSAVVFSVYPIRIPRHGGQIRARQLLKAYRAVFKKVTYVALCNSSVYLANARYKNDIPTSPRLTREIQDNPHLEALLIGMAAESEPNFSELVRSVIRKETPHTIILEQPFLGPAVFKILSEPEFQHISVIYSSQNIEDRLHLPLLLEHPGSEPTHLAIDWLAAAEAQAIERSSAVISVSESEAAILRDRGARSVFVTPNGASPPSRVSKLVRSRVARELRQAGLERYVIFVASAHQPNVDGFLSLIGSRLGFLPPDTGILIVGTVSSLLTSEIARIDPLWADLFGHRCLSWGPASDETLTALISRANGIILPITTGEGTNLKTPEAILSGKPVVATTRAFRGFEDYLSLARVELADDPVSFRHRITNILSGSTHQVIPAPLGGQGPLADVESEKLTWSYSLHRLSSWLSESV